jgi:hypothetical protein
MSGRGRLLLATTTVAILLAMAGCTADPSPAPTESMPAPTIPSASPSASPSAAPPALTCDLLLPADAAAAAASVPAETLTVVDPGVDHGRMSAVVRAMTEAAQANAGFIECARFQPDRTDPGPAGVLLAVLPNSADAFALVQPDVLHGPHGLAPADVGDNGYIACHVGGGGFLCKLDAVSGGTWFSMRVFPNPVDTGPMIALGKTIAAQVAGAHPVGPATTPVNCDSLTDPDALAALKLHATDLATIDDLELDNNSRIALAALRQRALAQCSWISPAVYGRVTMLAIPRDLQADTSATGNAQPNAALQPLDGLGQDAISGCSGGTCEVYALGDRVWLSVYAYGDPGEDLDALQALAAVLLARLGG